MKTLPIFFLLAIPVFAQDPIETNPQKAPPFSKPPKLELAFDDDFEANPIKHYKTTGEVCWENGRLTLSPESTLQRQLTNAGPWIVLNLDLKFPILTKDGQTSELKIWLDTKSQDDLCIWFRQKREDSKVRSAVFICKSEGDWSLDRKLSRIRKPFVTEQHLGEGVWNISHRNGAWAVTKADEPDIHAYSFGNSSASSIVIQNQSFDTILRGLTVFNSTETKQSYTKPQLSDLRRAIQINQQVVALWNAGQANKAIDIAKESLEIRSRILGKYHPQTSVSLFNLAAQYEGSGDYLKAESLYLDAKKVHLDLYGKLHPEYAAVLNNLAGLYNLMGLYEKSEKYFLEANDIKRRVLGSTHPSYALSLNNLALLYKSTGDYSKAVELLVQAEKIIRTSLGGTHPNHIQCLNNLAFLYNAIGEYEKAKPLLIQSKQAREKKFGENHPEFADSLNNLAAHYAAMGDLKRAESLFIQARRIYEKAVGKNHQLYLIGCNNLAANFQAKGDFENAELILIDVLEARKKTIGDSHPDYAVSLSNLGRLYHELGAFEKAEPLYLESLEIRKKILGVLHPDYALSLNNLAGLYALMGLSEKALSLFIEAKNVRAKSLGTENPNFATSLHNLASVYGKQGNYEKALQMHQRAKEIRERVYGRKHQDYAQSLNSIASIFYTTGKLKQSEKYYLDAKEIFESIYGKEHPRYATSLNNLAALYDEMGDQNKALALYSEAKSIRARTLGTNHPEYAESLGNLGVQYEIAGNFSKAERLYRESLEVINQNMDRYAAIQSEMQQLGYQVKFSEYLGNYISVCQKNTDHNPIDLFESILNWKGQIQLRQFLYRKSASTQDFDELFSDLRTNSQQLYQHANSDPTQAGWQTRLEELTEQKESLEKELATRNAEIAKTRTTITAQELQKSIPQNAVYILLHEYQPSSHNENAPHSGNRRLQAFVLHHTGDLKSVDLGDALSIKIKIREFRKHLTAGSSYRLAALALRNKLWLPLEKHFKRQTKTILISTDGELGTLPFCALPGKGNGDFLLNEYQFVTLPIPRLLTKIAEKPERAWQNNSKTVLVGNVNYSRTAEVHEAKQTRLTSSWRGADDVLEGEWRSLDNTGKEIDAIKRTLLQTKVTSQANIQVLEAEFASEDRFYDVAPTSNIIHVATHGFFADPKFETLRTSAPLKENRFPMSESQRSAQFFKMRNPGILSGLVFSGANSKTRSSSQNDGIMTADEISGLPLENVDLVTLSACETGLGKAAGGEGLIGIQRAFQISGARTTVASLWKVDDLATRKLMERFYRNMFEKKMSKVAALSEAQRWILNNPSEHSELRGKGKLKTKSSKNSKTIHPRFWAAWVLSGDWK